MNEESGTAAMPQSASGCSRLPLVTAIEVVLVGEQAMPAAFPAEGLAGVDAGGPIERLGPLPIAPQRWLWLGADASEAARLAGDGAQIVDVEGKWTVFECAGAAARRSLASAVDVDLVLDARRCASVTLFDCPAVLLRAGTDRYVVCVHSSYASSFEAAFAAASKAACHGQDPGRRGEGPRFEDGSPDGSQ
jgi:heterotetrameric sarcosine oxidase gamma subunit